MVTHQWCIDRENPRWSHPSSSQDGGIYLSSVYARKALWDTRTIKVSFLGGRCDQRSEVRKIASEWTLYSNIDFIFVDQSDEGDIRVSFNANIGSWSYVGTNAKILNPREATMNFDRVSPLTIRHEFGHALGLNHEHQNPHGGIRWNETALLEYYSRPGIGWTKEKIELNILNVYNKDQTNGVYDRYSIMHYEILSNHTINGCCGTHGNDNLSAGDKRIMQQLYGKFDHLKRDADWAVKWNGIGRSNNARHNYESSWKGNSLGSDKKKDLIRKIHCQPASEVYTGLLSRINSRFSAYGTCLVGIVRGMPTFFVQGMYGSHGHNGYPKNPTTKDGTGHLRGCYNEHRLTGLCLLAKVEERAKQTLLYAIENDVCTNLP